MSGCYWKFLCARALGLGRFAPSTMTSTNKGIEDMSPEVLERILQHTTLNDKLRLRACSRMLWEYVSGRIPELWRPEECVISELNLYKLKNSLHISVDIDDVSTAQYFHDITECAREHWKRKNPKKGNMRCWFTFPYDGRRDFAFFEKAQITSFVMDNRIPFHLTPENMRWMCTLLRGCKIDKLSLLFEASTLSQLADVPDLASIVKARHFEFVVQSVPKCTRHAIAPTLGNLAKRLAGVGVQEVSVIGDQRFGKDIAEMRNLCVDFNLVMSFLRAGITQITFDAEFEDHHSGRGLKYLAFMEKVALSRLPVRIIFRSENLPDAHGIDEFQASPDHPKYITSRTTLNAHRPKEQLLITIEK